jgi:hypothetical protein
MIVKRALIHRSLSTWYPTELQHFLNFNAMYLEKEPKCFVLQLCFSILNSQKFLRAFQTRSGYLDVSEPENTSVILVP